MFVQERIDKIMELFLQSDELRKMNEITIPDLTRVDENVEVPLLHETRLGGCKIEKYVIRGVALGAK